MGALRLTAALAWSLTVVLAAEPEAVIFSDGRIVHLPPDLEIYSEGFKKQIFNCSAEEKVIEAEADLAGLDTMHVVYASDAASLVGLVASMLSVVKTLYPPEKVAFHLIVSPSLQAEAVSACDCFLREMVAEPGVETNVHFHRLLPSMLDLDMHRIQDTIRGRNDLVLPEVFARYYLAAYLPAQVRRAIWLDVDTIVRSSLRTLYRLRMEHALAAVPTKRIRDFFQPSYHRHFADLNELAFNTGVLVYDLDKWRAGELAQALEELTRKTGELDTLVMNAVFAGRFDVLDQRWNFRVMGADAEQVPFMPLRCLHFAHVLHWKGPRKPWQSRRGAAPYAFMFDPFDMRERCSDLFA